MAQPKKKTCHCLHFLYCFYLVEINECSSLPCQNGGVCIDGVVGYTCNCFDGYTGLNCETGTNKNNNNNVNICIVLSTGAAKSFNIV